MKATYSRSQCLESNKSPISKGYCLVNFALVVGETNHQFPIRLLLPIWLLF